MKKRLRRKTISTYSNYVFSIANANHLDKAVARIVAITMLYSGYTARCITSNVYKYRKRKIINSKENNVTIDNIGIKFQNEE